MEPVHLQMPTIKVSEKHTFINVEDSSDSQSDDRVAKSGRRDRAFTDPGGIGRSCCKAFEDDICNDGCHDSTDYDCLDLRSTCSWTTEAGDDETASEHSSPVSCSSPVVGSATGGPACDLAHVPRAAHLAWADMESAPAMFHPTFLTMAANGPSASYTDFALVCFVCPQQLAGPIQMLTPSSGKSSADAPSCFGANIKQGRVTASVRRRERRVAKLSKRRAGGRNDSVGWGNSTLMKDAGVIETNMPTTINLKNLPADCTLSNVLDTLDREGFSGYYNFVHVPVNFATKATLGYAQVNLLDHALAKLLCQHFQGFNNWAASTNSCEPSGPCADWTVFHEGLEALITRYRNSPLMHESVPEEYKPTLFNNGRRVPFPASTVRLKAPRMRHVKQRDLIGENEG